MFSLIITIVSIALVVALVAATMYYGGDTLGQGRASADAAAFVTGAQQLGAAITTHAAFGGVTALTDASVVSPVRATNGLLNDNILTNLPPAPFASGTWVVTLADRTIEATVQKEVCDSLRTQAGAGGNYSCPDSAPYTFLFNY